MIHRHEYQGYSSSHYHGCHRILESVEAASQDRLGRPGEDSHAVEVERRCREGGVLR